MVVASGKRAGAVAAAAHGRSAAAVEVGKSEVKAGAVAAGIEVAIYLPCRALFDTLLIKSVFYMLNM